MLKIVNLDHDFERFVLALAQELEDTFDLTGILFVSYCNSTVFIGSKTTPTYIRYTYDFDKSQYDNIAIVSDTYDLTF